MKTIVKEKQDVLIDYIVRFGKTEYKIVYGSKSSKAQRYAAEELSLFLSQITGVELPIIADANLKWDKNKTYISIGATSLLRQSGISFDYSKLNGDGFFIKTSGKSLFINGFNDRGVIYGTYDFLESTTGLRFVAHDCTYVPKMTELPLYETDRIEVPAFEYRGYFANVVFQEYTDEALAVRMRMNYAYAQISRERGGKIGWYKADGMEPTHNVLWWVSPGDKSNPSALINTHPDFFVYDKEGEPIEICWSKGITDDGKIDENVESSPIKTAIENMKRAAKASPEYIDVFMLGIMDGAWNGSETACSCPKCTEATKKYKWSGVVIRFINLLADELNKFALSELGDRSIKVVTLAYSRTLDAPVENGELLDPTCKPRDNVYILIAPYFGDLYLPYNDPRQDSKLRNLFSEWAAVHDKFFLWGYTIANNSCLNNGLFYFNNQKMWPQLFSHMKSFGVTYMTLQGQYSEKYLFQPNFDCYIASKMMWNPDADVNALREEYIRLYYGPAAKFVSRVINRFDAFYAMEVAYNELNYRQESQWIRLQKKYHPYDFLKSQLELLNTGLAMVKLPSHISGLDKNEEKLIIRRVKEIIVTVKYHILLFFEDYFPDKIYEKKQYAKELFDECEEIGIKNVSEYQGLDVARALFGIN